ncbi:TatD family hydrolase [Chloroflexota bacterium]
MMDILRQEVGPDLRGAIHGFSNDRAALQDWLGLGFYVSVGIRGFLVNETPSLGDTVREIPLERLLTETDSAAIEQPASPADVLIVIQKLASLKGTTADEIGNAATANLKRLLKL